MAASSESSITPASGAACSFPALSAHDALPRLRSAQEAAARAVSAQEAEAQLASLQEASAQLAAAQDASAHEASALAFAAQLAASNAREPLTGFETINAFSALFGFGGLSVSI